MPSPFRGLSDIQADVTAGRMTQEQAIAEINSRGAAGTLRTPRKGARVVAITLGLIGFLFLCIGGGFGVYSHLKAQDAERVEGAVVKLERTGGKGSTRPVVHFQVNGQSFGISGTVSSSPPAYQVGEKVTVLYKRDNPGDAQIDSFVERWLFPVIFGGIGLLLFVIAVVLGLAMRPRRKALSDEELALLPK